MTAISRAEILNAKVKCLHMRNQKYASPDADVCTFGDATERLHTSQDMQEDCAHFISPQAQRGAEEGEPQVKSMTEPIVNLTANL